MHKYLFFAALVLLLALTDGALLLLGHAKSAGMADAGENNLTIVRSLGLTDLALWTEARYTRHPSQSDFFSPFQDLPGGMEHFPAGSLLSPPDHLRNRSGDEGAASGAGRL